MKRTLGLDLGTNSLGWAILDDVSGDILDKGVVVFPDGMKTGARSSADTRAATRRNARMGRRIKFRRRLRKWCLLKLLIDAKMCPLTQAELDAWKTSGTYPLGNCAFIDWLKATDTSNPYCDRAAAAEGKVPPFTLGRALYHLVQRRGFKSSRKEEAAQIDPESGKAKKPDKETGKVKGDIAALTKEITEAGCKTLGQYFYKCLEDQKNNIVKKRIRNRYTSRIEHYLVEFHVIMKAQGLDVQNPKLCRALEDAIFMQRPLRSQKHLVGRCPLEPAYPRVQISHPAFEEFRMRTFINNLAFEKEGEDYRDENGNLRHPLTAADRERVATAFMKKAAYIDFEAISKLFKDDPRFTQDGFRFHYYRDDDSVSTCSVRHKIKSAFGDVAYDEQKVYDALTFFDDTVKLETWFRKHYSELSDKAIGELLKIHPQEGYAQYSLKAINRILPFLRKGYELSFSRDLAKLADVIPDFAAREEEIVSHVSVMRFESRQDRRAHDLLPEIIRRKTPTPKNFHDRYIAYLCDELGLNEKALEKVKRYVDGDKVYVAQTFERDNKTYYRLPKVELGMIRNPSVQRAMTTLRRLVNYLSDHDKIDIDDTVRIELTREVNDFATRKAYQNWQMKRAKKRQEAVIEITNLGRPVTEDAIERYVLWDEQGKRCLYSGDTIDITDLFNEDKYEIEHTIPRSLSGDNSLANKTICQTEYNREKKKGRVPRDCPDFDKIDVLLGSLRKRLERLEANYRTEVRNSRKTTDPATRCSARIKALTIRFDRDYWRDKIRRFYIESKQLAEPNEKLCNFKKRQLVDTGVMCKHAVELLKCVYKNTYAVNGAATAFARKAWGIQEDNVKDRSDHMHHAKDAMVIAALTPKRFNAICAALKDDGQQKEKKRLCDLCPKPYPNFAEKVRTACEDILVKNVMRDTTLRQSSKRNVLANPHPNKKEPGKMVSAVLSRGDTVRVKLHNDTFYGCITDPHDGTQKKVLRISLVGPIDEFEDYISEIVDPVIRQVVKDAVAKYKAEGVTHIEPGMIKMPSGVPINKVRVFTSEANKARKLRTHTMPSKKAYKNPYYVTSGAGSNFRLALFEENGKISSKPDNALVWAQNHKRADYVPYDKQPGFLGYIMPNSMVLCKNGLTEDVSKLSIQELRKRLYVVISTGGESEDRAEFRLASAAGQKNELGKKASAINVDNPPKLLRLVPNKFLNQMLFEGIHFTMHLDGTIHFIER